ncbi:hypothetical protein ATY77_30825 [Rhizobium sp. R634]|nr:hypothetical protein ATY77_30825 [Rhizobium sp. R634]
MAAVDATEGELPLLRIHDDPWAFQIAEQGGVFQSLGDVATSLYEVDYELGEYFTALQRMTPSDADFDDETVNLILNIDVESPADGHANCFPKAVIAKDDAVLCTVGSNILVGFLRDGEWSLDHLAFHSGGQDFVVDHIATIEHATAFIERSRNTARSHLTARTFWENKALAFPNLTFGTQIEDNLKKFSGQMLKLLFLRLADLDKRTSDWKTTGTFPDAMPPITGESGPTMAKYGDTRKFKDEAGDIEIFEEHIWVDSLHRIHLLKEPKTKTIKIGYIGRHLPTIKHRT